MPIHTLKREGRRYAIGDFPVLPAFGMETFESQTLNFGGLEWGWAAGGVVTTYAGRTSYEDFETSTLNGGGNDFGWAGSGLIFFTATAAFSSAFADLSSTITATVTTSGSGSFTYQWYQNGVALANGGEYSGVTTATVTITGVTSPDYTTYYCIVTNLGSSTQTNTITLIDRSTDWSNRVVTNGGAAPAVGTVTALRTFWNGVITDGVSAKVVCFNPIVPDNFIASLTPFVKGAGSDPWTNHSFVLGDLSVNGLTGTIASSKFLDTGFSLTSFASAQSAGLIIYAFSITGTGTECELGAYGTQGIIDYLKLGGNALGFNGTIASNEIVVANPGNGYFCDSRVSSTDHRLFFANSGHAHAQLGATDVTAFAGTLPNTTLYAFAEHNSGGAGSFCSDTLSGLGAHSGFSAADSSAFFSRFQTLRTSFGGGFV